MKQEDTGCCLKQLINHFGANFCTSYGSSFFIFHATIIGGNSCGNFQEIAPLVIATSHDPLDLTETGDVSLGWACSSGQKFIWVAKSQIVHKSV